MDVKVYKKETVSQPSGYESVFVPDVIDIIPELVNDEQTDIENNKWYVDKLKNLGTVDINDNKLLLDSEDITFADNKIIVSTESYVKEHKWNIDKLKELGTVKVEGHKLIIDSEYIHYSNGKLYVYVQTKQLTNCATVTGKDELEQACTLATIFQKGLDPLDLNDGIRWSEAIREEISGLQLIQDIIEAVGKVSTSVNVVFDTVEDGNGNQYLSYKLLEAV